ncbi:zinc-ribbon domain-containing protein [Streptococcus oralis]|uniref:zinc-ribbon domain-containing protein n=1 Tax=Streptococcus oralis TaxID=1303 RepID=UPI0021D8D1F2|nr:zinc-ribbon domain-containing protein [Streptococcus oralis]
MCNSNYRAWWKCSLCKGEYQQEVQSKVIIKKPCPYCTNKKVLEGFNDLATTHSYCKGYRRKKEHFVQFKNIDK